MQPTQHLHESKNNPDLPQVSTKILANLQETKGLVDEAIGKMRTQQEVLLERKRKIEEILLEKKRKIEEIVVMCEESGNEEIIPFAEILRETEDINEIDGR